VNPALGRVLTRSDTAGILLDFDGTLSPIVTRPEDAGLLPGAREVLASLVDRFPLVAIVSGRPAPDLHRLVGVRGIRYEGLYGLRPGVRLAGPVMEAVSGATRAVPGARVEAKGITVAVHYREADDPANARHSLAASLAALAEETGYDLLEGKMVFELAPAGESRKGGAVGRLVREHRLGAALYAGDDLPDLEAFASLDALAGDGLATAKVAVGGAEVPQALARDADVVVDSPANLVELLRALGSP
jgi:trehalose 6-phosphate phosphatase